MNADGDAAAVVSPSSDSQTPSQRRWITLATGLVWVGGSGLVAIAQSDSDRRLSALGGAGAGILAILVVSRLTADPERRYIRSVVGAIVAVSVVSEWLLWHLVPSTSGFEIDGMVKRIVLPLLVVLLAPPAAQALWTRRSELRRAVRPMDWIVALYGSVVLVPALLVGLAHHNQHLYVAQDLGLIVFFVFMYVVGRAVTADAARASAGEIVDVLLLLAAARWMLVSWDVFPIYSYFEAAAAGALAVLILRPRSARRLTVGLAVILLVLDAVQIKTGSNSSTAVELAGALGILVYLALRVRRVLPQWLLIAGALVAIAGFVGLTSDGAALRGQYYGPDPSNLGRTYEAHQVRAAVGHSPSALFGRGLGGTIDETGAPAAFKTTLVYGGRDLAHVQEIHLLPFAFLLKTGYLGLAWLAVFLAGLAISVVRALERAVRERDPSLVLYAGLALLAVVQAFAASSRLQSNPLTGLAFGVLVTCLGARQASLVPLFRAHRREILAGAACTLAGLVAVAYVSAHRTTTYESVATLPNQPVSLWIGDAYTIGAGATTSATGEALATSAALHWQTDMDAEGATGFVRNGRKTDPSYRSIPDRLKKDAVTFSPPPPAVVVLDAGRNDLGVPRGVLRRAVRKSFRLLDKGFPASAVVVIAPFVMTSKPTNYLALRRLERQLARKYGFAFVDPIAERWINRDSAKLLKRGVPGIFPNQLGYDYIVAHLAPAITKALAAAHETVRIHCTKAAPCRRRAPRRR